MSRKHDRAVSKHENEICYIYVKSNSTKDILVQSLWRMFHRAKWIFQARNTHCNSLILNISLNDK